MGYYFTILFTLKPVIAGKCDNDNGKNVLGFVYHFSFILGFLWVLWKILFQKITRSLPSPIIPTKHYRPGFENTTVFHSYLLENSGNILNFTEISNKFDEFLNFRTLLQAEPESSALFLHTVPLYLFLIYFF